MEKIIKKKLLLIVSMLAVTFALAGCSSSDKKVEFDYDGNTLVQIAETQATNYMQIAQVEDVYNFYVDEEANGGQVDETTADALKVFSTIESDYGKFQQFKPVNLEDEDDKTIQEVDDKVVVTLYAECAEKEAIVKATFVDNSVTYNFQKYSVMAQNQYSEEEADQMLASNGVYPYKISEFEVAAATPRLREAATPIFFSFLMIFTRSSSAYPSSAPVRSSVEQSSTIMTSTGIPCFITESTAE